MRQTNAKHSCILAAMKEAGAPHTRDEFLAWFYMGEVPEFIHPEDEGGRKQLEAFRLAPWASRRREDLLQWLDRLNPTIAELSQAIEQEVEKCPAAQRLMTHPGVGALTALAFMLIIERADRFQCGKQIASYLGLVPLEDSSGSRRRLGHITKQGNSLLRFLLVEAAQVTVRSDPEWRSQYHHLMMRRGRKIAKVARARRLAVRMYWMMRQEWNYEQLKKFGSQGRKLSSSYCREQGFDSVAEAAEFPDHSIGAGVALTLRSPRDLALRKRTPRWRMIQMRRQRRWAMAPIV